MARAGRQNEVARRIDRQAKLGEPLIDDLPLLAVFSRGLASAGEVATAITRREAAGIDRRHLGALPHHTARLGPPHRDRQQLERMGNQQPRRLLRRRDVRDLFEADRFTQVLAVPQHVGNAAGMKRSRTSLNPVDMRQILFVQVLHGNMAIEHPSHLTGTAFTAAGSCRTRMWIELDPLRVLLGRCLMPPQQETFGAAQWLAKAITKISRPRSGPLLHTYTGEQRYNMCVQQNPHDSYRMRETFGTVSATKTISLPPVILLTKTSNNHTLDGDPGVIGPSYSPSRKWGVVAYGHPRVAAQNCVAPLDARAAPIQGAHRNGRENEQRPHDVV